MEANWMTIIRRTISLPKRLPRKKKKALKNAMSYIWAENEPIYLGNFSGDDLKQEQNKIDLSKPLI